MTFPACTDIENPLEDISSTSQSEQPDSHNDSVVDTEFSRRSFVKTAGMLSAALAAGLPQLATAQDGHAAAASTPHTMSLTLKVNGTSHALTLDTRTTLLDALRETLAAHRQQEGLRPRPMRSLHRAR